MLILNLKEIMDMKKETIQDVYEGTGISRNTISQLYNGKSKGIQFLTLTKLVNYLDIAPEEMFIEASNYKDLRFDVDFNSENIVQKIINKSFKITPKGLNDAVDDLEYLAMVQFIPSKYEKEDYAVIEFKIPISITFNSLGNVLWFYCDRYSAENFDDVGIEYDYVKHESSYKEFIRSNSKKDIEDTFLSIVSYISSKFSFIKKPEYFGFRSDFGNRELVFLWTSDIIFNSKKQSSYINSKYSI
jgi:DNA-binding Xre family transcriptional regulator